MARSRNLLDEFWEKLEAKYRELPTGNGAKDYQAEKPILNVVLKAVGEKIRSRYTFLDPIGVGGTAVVIKVRDRLLDLPFALKCSRPVQGREPLLAEIMRNEISKLLTMRHPNIVQVHYHSKIRADGREFPFFIMEFIEGASDARKFFAQAQPLDRVLGVVKQIAEGLCHMHKLRTVHMDIKLDNVLVAPSGRAVISDLGSARRISSSKEKTLAIFDRRFAHPDIRDLPSVTDDELRRRVPMARNELRIAFDLYSLGRCILELIEAQDATAQPIDPYHRKYLGLMGCRLLDGQNEGKTQQALGMGREALAEMKYSDINDVAIDIRKLTGEYPLATYVPELDTSGMHAIQTSSLFPTPLTPALEASLAHPSLRRLAGISQLGFISLVYPTATNSRLQHVLGTYSNVVRYCLALYNDPVNPLFRQLFKPAELRAVLAASLLHDIGQYPLAHDIEEATGLFSHKKIALEMISRRKPYQGAPPLRSLLKEAWQVDPDLVANIISADVTDDKSPIKQRILHTILDGPIDADKLDYLVRDSDTLGLHYGDSIDVRRLLQCLTVCFRSQGDGAHAALGIHEKGKFAAETIAFARYAMFGQVYWHHSSRAAKAMFHRAIWETESKGHNLEEGPFMRRLVRFIYTLKASHTKESQALAKASATQLQPADLEMLKWWSTQTTDVGRKLLEMLSGRVLYKRLLVISAERDSGRWKKLDEFRDRHKRDLRAVSSLEREVEKEFLEQLDKKAKQKTNGTRIPQLDNAAFAEWRSSGAPLILVDIPYKRPEDVALEFLPESDRRDVLAEWKDPKVLGDSELWSYLDQDFVKLVGKIRIFCHPAVRDVLDKEKIRKILGEAVDKCLSRNLPKYRE
ncbi:MAG: protein kinase [Armatimonadetes bacterium]|nr:protein kinase [Armatimonadota bacterium]